MQTCFLIGAGVEELHNERGCVLRVGRVGFSNDTKALDTSGHNNHGTNENGCVWDYDKNAYHSPVKNDRVLVPTDSTLDMTDRSLTISYWWYRTTDTVGYYTSVNKMDFPNTGYSTYLHVLSSTKHQYNCRVAGYGHITDIGAGNYLNIPINTWHHFAAVFNDITDKGKWFFDGKEIFSKSVTHSINGATTIPCTVGHSLVGYWGNVHIYNRALSATEIHKLYLQGKEKHK